MNDNNKPAAILLAAGASSRMGENKLLKLWRGKPLLCHALAAALDGKKAGLLSVIVAVCGRDAGQTSKLLADADIIVNNDNYTSGIASSLICGINALPQSCRAAVVILGDMPCIDRGDIAAVINAWKKCECDIVAAAHNGKRGHPVLLSAKVFTKAKTLSADIGARALFNHFHTHLAEAGRGVLIDMDTPEQMTAAL